jgi:exodeoxyribonuclease V beta subunit
MTGPDVPRQDGLPCGVLAWHPPGAMIAALSDLLDRGIA